MNKETVMLKLHGFAVSNYFNMVHLALLEKGRNPVPALDATVLQAMRRVIDAVLMPWSRRPAVPSNTYE